MSQSLEATSGTGVALSSIEDTLREVHDLTHDVLNPPPDKTVEIDPEEISELLLLPGDIAPRVDKLIEQIGGTSIIIGGAKFEFMNGGPTVDARQSYDFELDSSTYPVSESITMILPQNGEPFSITGQLGVYDPAFKRAASGEFSFDPLHLLTRMDSIIRTVEHHIELTVPTPKAA